MSDEYESHCNNLQRKAEEAHKKWFKSLPKEEQTKLKKSNLDKPSEDRSEVGGKSPYQPHDIAESSIASYTPEIDIDSPADTFADRFQISPQKAAQILEWHEKETEKASEYRESRRTQKIVSGILMSDNPRLACAGLAFATNLDTLNNINQTNFAKKYNISRSNISKETKYWQTTLGLPTSCHQKSEEACERYSQTKKRAHWRNTIFKKTRKPKKSSNRKKR